MLYYIRKINLTIPIIPKKPKSTKPEKYKH